MVESPDYVALAQKSGRRRSPRVDAVLDITITFQTEGGVWSQVTGFVKNASMRGFACALAAPVPAQSKNFRVTLTDAEQTFQADCEVRWRQDAEKMYGVCFQAPQPSWWNMISEMQKKNNWQETTDRRRAWRTKARKQ